AAGPAPSVRAMCAESLRSVGSFTNSDFGSVPRPGKASASLPASSTTMSESNPRSPESFLSRSSAERGKALTAETRSRSFESTGGLSEACGTDPPTPVAAGGGVGGGFGAAGGGGGVGSGGGRGGGRGVRTRNRTRSRKRIRIRSRTRKRIRMRIRSLGSERFVLELDDLHLRLEDAHLLAEEGDQRVVGGRGRRGRGVSFAVGLLG